jgi:polynucleotide 5'-hydroxyl-kinase GRC3/NOL9
MTEATSDGPSIEPSWWDLVERLRASSAHRRVYVVGGADTGKTTLSQFLFGELGTDTGFVDCDPGQSWVGPPTTLALCWSVARARPAALVFVGSISPSGYFLQTVVGIRRLVEHGCTRGARRLVLDASGYAEGGAGREFQYQAVDAVSGCELVALQRGDELEPLLRNFDRRCDVHVHRLEPSQAVRSRTRADRQAYRRRRFAEYFADASEHRMALQGVGMHGVLPQPWSDESCRGRMVAPCDAHGWALAVGLVDDIDVRAGTLVLRAPPFDPSHVTSLRWGDPAS